MQQEKVKRNAVAIAVSVGAHVALIALLFVLHLRAAPHEEPEELILVNFGITELSSGDFEPAPQETASNPDVQTEQTPTQKQPVVKKQQAPAESDLRQDVEPAPHLAKAEKARQEAEMKRKREAEEARKRAEAAAEAERKRKAEAGKAINNNVAGAFGRGAEQGNTQGSGTQANGNQGNPGGSGSSYSLTGRTIVGNGGYPEKPRYSKPIRGTVRVNIVVNNAGRVTDASIRLRGTNITDAAAQRAAIEAAKTTRFNSIAGGGDQEGVITYHFDIK